MGWQDGKPVANWQRGTPVGAPPDPAVIAHAASDAAPAQAAQALDVADKTGVTPSYAAAGLDESVKALDKTKFADALRGRPALSAWAAQSPQHAAAVRPDAEPLGEMEGWLSGMGDYSPEVAEAGERWFKGVGDAFVQGLADIGGAEAMRERMGSGGPLADAALPMEEAAREYDSQPHGFIQQVARAAPQMVLYGATELLTGPIGVAGLLYSQNKGVLARQIEKAQPAPPEDTRPWSADGRSRVGPEPEDDRLTPEEIDRYATVGSAAGAVTLAGLLSPILRSLPGVKGALQGVVGETLARAGATTWGAAAVRGLLSYGKHTFMGALGMALQHTINSATVTEAAGNNLDAGQLRREGLQTFKEVLPVVMTFAAYGPARELMADRGRMNMAPGEQAKLAAMVELAKKIQLTKTAPDRAAELFGLMGRGVKVYIDNVVAQKMKGLPAADVAAASVAQDSVAVPAGEYLAKLADQHEAIKDDVKLSADGMTMNEARARDKELRDDLGDVDVSDAILGKQTPDDILQFELPFPKTEEKTAPPKAPPAELKFQASFQNKETGEVINTGPFHDLSQLPGGTNAHASGKFVDGFTDQTGKFYTREQAAKALNTRGRELASGGLSTEDLARMEKEREGVPSTFAHGTSEVVAAKIKSTGVFDPRRGARNYDYSEFGRDATYLAPERSWWFSNPDSGRAVSYRGVVKAELAPGADIRHIRNSADLDALARELGFENGKKLMRAWSVDGLKEAEPRPESDFEKSDAITKLALEKGIDAIYIDDGLELGEAAGPQLAVFNSKVIRVPEFELAKTFVEQYGGTVEKWQERLTPELIAALKDEGANGAVAPKEYAARLIEAMQVRDINPEPFERLANKSDKYIREAAEKARSGSAAGARASSPADVAILSTHELARDVNRAKAERATEVRAEMDKISETLAKQAKNDKLRALLNRAGEPLLRLFDSLTRGTDSTGALQDAVQWLRDAARPVAFDEQAIGKYLADPKPFGELRPAQARIIADAVKQLALVAREENIIRAADAEATVADAAGEIRGELRQNPDKGLPLPSGVPSDAWRNTKLLANAANAVMLRPKNNLREKSAAAVKWIFDRINNAVYDRDALFREVGGMWKAAFEAMPDDIAKRRFESYDLSDKLPTKHLGLEPLDHVPRQFLWKLARHRMSAGNMDRVLSTSGWDAGAVDSILFDDPKTKLTVPEWDYLQSVADVNEKYVWPKIKAHFEKFYGMASPKTAGVPFKVQLEDGSFKDYAGGYEPLKRDARPGVAPQPEPTKGIAQYWDGNYQIPWTPGSVKERVDNSHYLVNMDWDSSRGSMASALHWLAFDQPVRDVAKLLNDPGLSADMNRYMGEGRANATRGWLKSSATQQSWSVPQGQEIIAKGLGWQRSLQLMQIVGGSVRLAVTQLSHPIGLMLGGKVNPIYGIPSFLSTFKPLTTAGGEVRLFPNWNDALTYGKEVQHRADRAYNILRQTWDTPGRTSRPGPLGALADVAGKTAGLYLHAVDRLTTSWAWTAFHNEAVGSLKMEPFSPEAIAYADGKTQDVMPVHDIETAAPILTNRMMGGFLIMHGFKNTLYNMRQDALAASAKDFHLANSPAQYGGAIARTAGRVALQTAMFGGFAIMGKLALGYAQQSDESKGTWLARDFLGGQAADIPFVGGLAEPMAKYMLGGTVTRRDFSSYGNPGMAALVKVQDTLGNLVNGGREDYKKVFDGLELALFLSGVPSRAPRVGAEHLYEILMGEGYSNPDQSDAAGRMFYTDRQWESVKRSLTPDEGLK